MLRRRPLHLRKQRGHEASGNTCCASEGGSEAGGSSACAKSSRTESRSAKDSSANSAGQGHNGCEGDHGDGKACKKTGGEEGGERITIRER